MDTKPLSEKDRGRLFAELSHEIRTPISGVIGLAHLLSGTELSDVQGEYVAAIRSCADSLLTVMNDILDFSQIEADNIPIQEEPFNLRETIAAVCDSLRPRAEESNLYLKLEIEESVPDRLCGDAVRIRQILNNLIGNAVRFTLQGGVIVRLDSCPAESEKARFLISVQDTGPGVSAELFESYVSIDGETSRRFAGAGLGLVIAKRLIDLMGGQLVMSTEQGVGNCFWFELELDEAEPVQRAVVGDAVVYSSDGLAGTHILIAEDDPINQMITLRYLEGLGCVITVCKNGRQVLDTFKEGRPDIVLMDCEMPELNGYQTTEIIRLHERGKGARVPIVAMTANAMIGDRERCLEAGMDDYLSKPVKPEHLVSVLQRFRWPDGMAA